MRQRAAGEINLSPAAFDIARWCSNSDRWEEGAIEDQPIAAGKDSFDLVEAEKILDALDLWEGTVLLDAASGRGSYALASAERLGDTGKVVALDLWQEGIECLRNEAERRHLGNLWVEVADLRQIPLSNQEVTSCLLASVLHDLVEDGSAEGALGELSRVIRPGGRFVVVEFKKIDPPPGPPRKIRLSPEVMIRLVEPFGFRPLETEQVGNYHYMVVFTREAESA